MNARTGLVLGSAIGLVFGLVFVEVNSGGLPGSWPVVVRVAGIVAALVLAAGLAWVARRGTVEGEPPGDGFAGRSYRIIVGVEVVALFGGLALLNAVFGEPKLAVPWIAFVVGVHFVFLGRAWRIPLYHGLGYAQSLLGVAGFALAIAGASAGTVHLVAGVFSGVALFAVVAVAIVRARPRIS